MKNWAKFNFNVVCTYLATIVFLGILRDPFGLSGVTVVCKYTCAVNPGNWHGFSQGT